MEMNGIGWAVKKMWNGQKVRRAGWNNKGMYVYLKKQEPGVGAYVLMLTAKGTIQPGWVCSQADLLSTDWELAE